MPTPGRADTLADHVQHHRASHAESEPLVRSLIEPGTRVLDMYFGAGLDAVDAAHAGADAQFVAPALAHARLTQRLAREYKADVGITVASLARLPFARARFDIVLARGALMFVPAPEAVIAEIARVLRPGGTLVAVLLNRRSWYPLLKRLARQPLVHPANPPFLRLETRRSAAGLFNGFAGLQIYQGRFPTRLGDTGGRAERLFNALVVPGFARLPKRLSQRFGYYHIVCANKPL